MVHERAPAARRPLDPDAHLVGAPHAGHVGRKLGDVLYDRGQAALCPRRDGGAGRDLSSADWRASLQWSPICLVLMPRQYMLGDCMIISGLYHVGPDSCSSKNVQPRALHWYRRASPFLAVGLLQHS